MSTARKKLKVAFTDFWHGNTAEEIKTNPIYQLLAQCYELELSECPDFLIYSCFGTRYLKYNCTRIFYTGENVRPDFDQCDYAFSFDYPVSERNYRLPLYFLYDQIDQLKGPAQGTGRISSRKFCNFLYSNKKAPERIEFFNLLNDYKRVDSGGKVLNNMGGRVANKLEFLRAYKFTIAFENSSYPGYTTEKIAEALIANTIPIYWGNPLVGQDFNPDRFINCHDYKGFGAVIERVKEIDNNDALFHRYISAPAFANGVDNEFVNSENLRKQLNRIFSGSTKSNVAGHFDWLKHMFHPARPRDFATSLARRIKQKRRQQGI